MTRSLILLFLAPLALAACGGSSSGGISPGTTPPPPPPPSGIAITSANALPVTKTSWEAANDSADLVGLVGTSGVIANNPGGINKTGSPAFATNVASRAIQAVPFGPDVLPCAVSGSITVSGDIADPFTPTLTANDVINVDADNCDDGLGEVLDGLLEMTIVAFSGDLLLSAYDMTATMTATDLQSTIAAEVATLNGQATVSLNSLQTPFISASVSGASMTTDANAVSETLTNFQTMQSFDGGLPTMPYMLNSAATLDSTQLADVISYSTPVTFTGENFGFPDSGELLVLGDNSSAHLITIDNVNVRIEIDNDGDSVVDETIDTTWVELTE